MASDEVALERRVGRAPEPVRGGQSWSWRARVYTEAPCVRKREREATVGAVGGDGELAAASASSQAGEWEVG